MSKFKIAVRWTTFIPGALVAFVLSFLAAKMFLSFPWWALGVRSGAPIFKIMEVVASGISGYFFVYFGAKIAPSNRSAIVYLLFSALLLLGGACILSSIYSNQWLEIIKILAVCFGGGIMLKMYTSGEETLD